MIRKAIVASLKPCTVDVVAGKHYFWCSCGASQNQPFCDGRHVAHNKKVGGNFKPVPYVSEEDDTVCFCTCKQSLDGAECDGSHGTIKVKKSPKKAE